MNLGKQESIHGYYDGLIERTVDLRYKTDNFRQHFVMLQKILLANWCKGEINRPAGVSLWPRVYNRCARLSVAGGPKSVVN